MGDDVKDIYFKAFICLRGDVDNAALTEEECFTLEDSQSRSWVCWVCRDVRKEAHSAMDVICEMQNRLMSAGYFNTGGTKMVVHITRLPEPITWEEQIRQLRKTLGEKRDDEDEGEEWKRGKEPL